MRIGVDIRCLVEGRRTGVEEYTINLLEEIFKRDKKNEYVLFLNSFRKPSFDLSEYGKFKNVVVKRFRIPNKIINFLFWYLKWPKIDKLIGGVDVMVLPNVSFGNFGREVKLILTVHDLSFERLKETFSLKRRLWHFFIGPKKLCERADRIIAVSQSTGGDIINTYRIIPDKIKVIYNAVSEEFKIVNRNDQKLIEIKNKYDLPYKFILYLGTIEPRKNIIGVIRSYNLLRKLNNQELNKYKLVIAGASGWKQKKIFDEIKKSPCGDDIVFVGFVDDEDKVFLYNLASLFVYPSFFEGFGFPPLEAMKCGVPVITSNNSSFPEIIGAGGIMIDPDKPQEIFQAMKEILTNKDLSEKMTVKGLSQTNKYSWRKTAGEFLKEIESLGK